MKNIYTSEFPPDYDSLQTVESACFLTWFDGFYVIIGLNNIKIKIANM